MSNKNPSKSDMRSAIIAFTTVAMLIAVTFGVSDVEAGNTLSLDVSDTEVVLWKVDLNG